MTTTETPAPLRRTRPATIEYLPHIRPFGRGQTPFYDTVTDNRTGLTTTEAIRLDRILRSLIVHMPGSRVKAVITFRDMLALGGVYIGLTEAKATIDAMALRIASEARP